MRMFVRPHIYSQQACTVQINEITLKSLYLNTPTPLANKFLCYKNGKFGSIFFMNLQRVAMKLRKFPVLRTPEANILVTSMRRDCLCFLT